MKGEMGGYVSNSALYFYTPIESPSDAKALLDLGSEYRYEEATEASRTHVVSPDPRFWCHKFIFSATQVLSQKIPYHGFVEAVDFFVSALAYSDKARFRRVKFYNQMLSLMDEVLDDENANEIARELAEKLKAREQEIRDNWASHAHLDEA